MKCDGCTFCCKVLPIPWMNSTAGKYCKECEPNIGCKIYSNAPKECIEFECAYTQMERASINMRPDICGVMFNRLDDIMVGTVDSMTLNSDVNGQLDSFKKEGFSLVLNRKGIEPYVDSQTYTRQEILDRISEEAKRISGST